MQIRLLLFTSLGVYVGVIPIMIGLLWYPYIRRISIGKYSFFLSLTAGLLVFLGIDALLEVNEIVIGNLASVFNGQALGILVTISTFVVLLYTSDRLTQRAIEKTVVRKTRSLTSSTSVGESSSQEKSVIENQKGEIYSEPTKGIFFNARDTDTITEIPGTFETPNYFDDDRNWNRSTQFW